METGITCFDALLSHPSDVAPYQPKILNAIRKFNHGFGRSNKIVIRPVEWQADTYPSLGTSGQALINEQIADKCDLILSFLKTRFGHPTDHFQSGTEEEIERALASDRDVFLFFIDEPVTPSEIDVDQYKEVVNFRKKHESNGLYSSARNADELENAVKTKLELYFQARLSSNGHTRAATGSRVLWVDDLPENNAELRDFFQEYGIKISVAINTNDALAMLDQIDYSLIISDMGRREGPREGYALLDELRDRGDTTPLVFFTADSRPEHLDETLAHGGQYSTSSGNALVDFVFKQLLRRR